MDIKHHFIEKGSGETIILLHGNSGDISCFKSQIEEFSMYYHVFAIDTRGHGKSPRGNAPFSIKQFADDLKEFMDEHNIKDAHILGFSDGGNIALEFVLKYPKKVKRLILNGANFIRPGLKWWFNAPIITAYYFCRLFSGISKKAKFIEEMFGLMVNEPNISLKELNSIEAKTLVLVGSHDIVKTSHSKTMASAIPNATLATVKGDHSIVYKHPEEYNKIVLDFLFS